MKVCGVDEAGRGSFLGPLVIAGIVITESKLDKLHSLGVKDSKKLNPLLREKVYKKLVKFSDSIFVIKIKPSAIDKKVTKHELNLLEAKYMAKIIKKLNPDLAYVDSFDVNPKRLSENLSKMSECEVIASHKADEKIPIVSAASIVAKIKRDKSINLLKKKYDIGSGYPIDSKTIEFVSEWYYKTAGSMPHFVRESWKTTKRISQEPVLP